jgi:hypothetical protein
VTLPPINVGICPRRTDPVSLRLIERVARDGPYGASPGEYCTVAPIPWSLAVASAFPAKA